MLSLIALLIVLAASAIELTRLHAQVAARSMESSQAYETADSAIRVALLNLGVQNATDVGRTLAEKTLIVHDTPVTVTVGYEAGRIDINYADRDLLFAALAAHGKADAEALATADRILDWRDSDDDKQPHGAERIEYVAARSPGPHNGPFDLVAELRLVMGAESLDENFLDMFTVYSHLPSARATDAPPSVLEALRWANARQLGGRTWLDGEIGNPGHVGGSRSMAGEAVRLDGCVQFSTASFCRRCIVRLTGNLQSPWQVLFWQTIYR